MDLKAATLAISSRKVDSTKLAFLISFSKVCSSMAATQCYDSLRTSHTDWVFSSFYHRDSSNRGIILSLQLTFASLDEAWCVF